MNALVEVEGLAKTFHLAGGSPVMALRGVDFTLARGEALGVVGESGCGKSTLARALLRLVEPSAGRILLEGEDMRALSRRELAARRRDMQIVFQDPFGALNPRHRVARIIGEPLAIHRAGDRAARAARVAELIAEVGLPADSGARYPHEFSGGQRQRVAIARALASRPKLIVADEPVSALDVSMQSQIVNLIGDLRRRLGLAVLFISHDLAVVGHLCDRIAVMYLGRIVEIGPAEAILGAPAHPYTQALLSAIPRIGDAARNRIVLSGDPPDPSQVSPGCDFAPRCRHAMDICRRLRPAPRESSARLVACHLSATGAAEQGHS